MKKSFKKFICIALCVVLAFASFTACNDPETPAAGKTYQVIFVENAGGDDRNILNFPEPQTVADGGLAKRPDAGPTRAGYDFTDWYADEDCEGAFDFSTKITRRTFVYAGWDVHISYVNVVFDSNFEGGPEDETVTMESGQTVSPSDSITRPGYRFVAWSTSPTEQYYFDLSNGVTEDLHLYAVWEKEWTVTYNLNYPDCPAPIPEVYAESEETVRPDDPERVSFVFAGWYTDVACTVAYEFGQKPAADADVFAKWTRVFWTVAFNLTYEGSETLYVEVSVDAAVSPPADPTRLGYVFVDWFADSDCTEYYDFAAVRGDGVVVYAGWVKTWIVTFNYNYGGAPVPVTQNVRAGESAEPFTPPVRSGYLFGGWYTDDACTVSYEFDPVTADETAYAKWTEDDGGNQSYTVTFDLNYTDSTSIQQEVVAGTSAVRPPEDPTREGYRFRAWVTTATGQSSYRFGAVTGNVTVYASWTKQWDVTFDLNYSGAGASVVKVDNSQRVLPPQNPTREGQWAFVEWNTQADGEGAAFSFASNIVADRHLYAKWIRTEYNITWDFNFIDAPDPAVTQVKRGGIAREPVRPSRQGYTVSGWYYDKDYTRPFSFGTEILSNYTLFAQWEQGFAYRLDLNYAGSPTIPTVVLPIDGTIPGKPQDPARSGGYTFMGWSVLPNGNPDFNGFDEPITGDLTLYAQWRHVYVFEAEYTDVSGVKGAGWSGGANAEAIIATDTVTSAADASNGYFLTYLYANGIEIFFDITSDREIDATLTLRLSAEQDTNNLPSGTLVLTDREYLVKVNEQEIRYGGITIENPYHAMVPQKKPFADVVTVGVHLVEGANRISLITNNSRSMGGTMSATAPMLDCIKIDTIAALTWDPILKNIS
ncbi:MAG: InlB B-repeat-containing protein [Clostridiales bacterium]|jgi:uncharacterized repeat protein (TIGR02543 family)|nr:InlB B-repeat-containing protein [Clostridiales bacterium]